MSKNPILSLVATVLAVVALAVALIGGNHQQVATSTPNGEPALGGLNHNTQENFDSGILTKNINQGGLLTVASGARHFTAAEICNNNVITLNGDSYASAQAQVLPSALNLTNTCLPKKGDYHDIMWINLSKDEAPTIGAGTTLDMYIASSSAGSTVEIPANRAVYTRFMNVEGSSISVQFQEYKHQ